MKRKSALTMVLLFMGTVAWAGEFSRVDEDFENGLDADPVDFQAFEDCASAPDLAAYQACLQP